MTAKPLPSAEALRKYFRYDHLSGLIFRRSDGVELFKYVTPIGYKRGWVCLDTKRLVFAHRVIWKMVNGYDAMEIDHIDGDKSNNRICNLRDVDRSANCRNVSIGKNNKSGCIGVSRNSNSKSKIWSAHCRINGKHTFLGNFADLNAAIAARKEAEKEYGYHPNHSRRTA